MTPTRAVLYARVSSDDRSNEGRNLDGQIAMCRDHALKNGWTVVAELAEDDRGASGAEFDLPQLNVVLGMARRSEFDVLVVREIDRLSRSLPKQLYIEDELKKTGVRIEYVLGLYPDTPEGNFMKHVRAAVAELERLKIRERAMRGRIQAVKAGSVLAYNRPPYGYDLTEDNGKYSLVAREDEAQIVRQVFDWYVHGDEDGNTLTLADMARRLTEMKVPTYSDKRYRGVTKERVVRHGRWNKGSLQKMLRNEVYAGTWRWGKSRRAGNRIVPTEPQEQIAVPVPPLVDTSTWQSAQRRLDRNRERSRRNRKHEYLLAGHIRCGRCNAAAKGTYRRQRGRVYSYYICGAKRNPQVYRHTCDALHFRREPVEEAVWQWLKAVLTDSEMLEMRLRAQQEDTEDRDAPVRERLTGIERQISTCQEQQGRLLDLYLANKLPMETWDTRNRALQDEISALRAEKANLEGKLEERRLTADQIRSVHDFAAQIAESIDLVDENYEVKRRIIDLLDVSVRLDIDEEGNRFADTTCVLSDEMLTIGSRTTARSRWCISGM